MGDDTGTKNVFESLAQERAKVEEERAKREQQQVVVEEAEPVYEADAVDEAGAADDAEPVDPTETTTLERTVDRDGDRFEETAEKVVEGLKGFGRALGQRYRKTTRAIKDADIPGKTKDRAGKIVGGVKDAHLGEKAKDRAGKIAEGVGTVAGAVTTGTKSGAEKFRDAKDKVRGIANPEKQLATLKELADLVMLYEPATGKNPALRTAAGVTSSVLVVGNTDYENKQLVDDLVAYVEASAAEAGYSMVRFDEFKDFEKSIFMKHVMGNTLEVNKQLINDLVSYVDEGTTGWVKTREFWEFEKYIKGNSIEVNKQLINDLVSYVEDSAGKEGAEESGPECRIVRLNKSYFVEGSNMRSNTNLRKLFEAAADPKGIAILLAEDMDLLYPQTGTRTEVLNSNARCDTGLRNVVRFQAQGGNYKGNWLLVCTTADKDGLPDCVDKIVEMEL